MWINYSASGLVFIAAGVLVAVVVYQFVVYWRNFRLRLQQHAEASLKELFLFVPLRTLLKMLFWPWLGVTVLAALTLPVIWLVGVMLLTGLSPVLGLRMLKKRRTRRFIQQLPDTLALVSAGLKSGTPLLTNLGLVATEVEAPMADEVRVLLRQIRLGEPFSDALQAWYRRMPSVDLERVVIALLLASQSGGQQAEILNRLATSMRAKQQLQLRVEALTAQGRMQGKVMSLLPLLMVCALWLIETPTMHRLAHHPLGWGSALLIVILLVCGYILIRRQVHIEVPL